jgi:homoserine O-acetyltransferase
MIFQFEASHDYNPRPHLEKITAHVWAVNFADDPINPPELKILEREIKRVRRGKAVVMPATKDTRGHGTHSLPAFWKPYLEKLLKSSR